MNSKLTTIFIALNLLIISILSIYAVSGPEASGAELEYVTISMDPGEFFAPIGITNVSNLQNIQNNHGGDYYLANDIDCSDTINWNNGSGFVPLGNVSNNFFGTFDGRGYKISNLWINRSAESYVGLFGYISSKALITNVTLLNASIRGQDYTGALVGMLDYCDIVNCSAQSNISGRNYLGGLVGYSGDGIITYSSSTGLVDGTGALVGGLVGVADNTIIDYSHSSSNANGTDEVAGLVGLTSGGSTYINNSHSTGAVTGDFILGGFVGYHDSGIINNSYSSGSVSSHPATSWGNSVGGFAGETIDAVIRNSFSTGDVSGSGEDVGGFAGRHQFGLISGCRSSGSVTGSDVDVGGFLGENLGGTVWKSTSSGNVINSANRTGGFVGFNHKQWDINAVGAIDQCFSNGSVSSTGNMTGGFAGLKMDGNISNSYSTGDVSGDNLVGGFAGKNIGGDISTSYGVGQVTGNSGTGGFLGNNSNGNITLCFWDNITSGMVTSDGGLGRSTTAMKLEATFSGWDFTGIWNIWEGVTYPFLDRFYDPPQILTTALDDAVEDEMYNFTVQASFSTLLFQNDLMWNMTTDAGAWLVHAGNGSLTGIPTNDDVGIYWVLVNITDYPGNFCTINFTLEVVNSNDPPELNESNVSSATEDVFYSIDFNATDIDPVQDNLTFGFSSNFTTGWLKINGTSGELYGTPGNADVGIHWVNVSVSDGNGGVDWTVFNLTVQNTNDKPTITLAAITKSAIEDQFFSVAITAVDMDPTHDTLTWSMTTDSGWLSIEGATGVVSGTPSNNDANKTFFINVTVSDGLGGSTWKKYDIFVINVNDIPSISTANVVTTLEDELYSVDYNAVDIDPTNDKLTWHLETSANWLTIDSETGVLSGTPQNRHVGRYNVNVSVNDGNQGENYTVFELTVENTNDPPKITTGDLVIAKVDESYYVVYSAIDPDPTGDKLSWGLKTDAAWLSMNSGTGVLSGTPGFEDIGTYTVNVTVSDDKLGTDSHEFVLEVILINNNPIITTKDVKEATAGVKYSVTYSAYDDRTAAEELSWSFESDATWLSFDTTTLTLSGTPTANDEGTYHVEFNVSDGEGGFTIHRFELKVVIPPPPNHPPKLSEGKLTPDGGNTETDFTFSVKYTDADGDPPTSIRVVIDGQAKAMTLSSGTAANGTYVFKTKLGEGTHTYYFTASDGKDTAVSDDGTPTTAANARSIPTISQPEEKEEGGLGTALLAVLIIIVIIVVVVILMLFRKRAEAGEEEKLECPECGAYVEYGEEVCPDCGEELEYEDIEEDEEEE